MRCKQAEITMETVDQQFARLNASGWPCSYHGERGDWFMLKNISQTRDSDALERSNFRVALRDLGGEGDEVAVERAGHWACGWVENLLVTGSKVQHAQELADSLANYPILCEEDFSELEMEEQWAWAKSELEHLRPDCWETDYDNAVESSSDFGESAMNRIVERLREQYEAEDNARDEAEYIAAQTTTSTEVTK